MTGPLDKLKSAKANLEDAMRALDQFVSESTGQVLGPLATQVRAGIKPGYDKTIKAINDHLGREEGAQVKEPDLPNGALPADQGEA